jgi:hypothetical protein
MSTWFGFSGWYMEVVKLKVAVHEINLPLAIGGNFFCSAFNIGAANMRLGYYLGQWGDAVPGASGRTCVPPEGPKGPLDAELLCWCCRLPASLESVG